MDQSLVIYEMEFTADFPMPFLVRKYWTGRTAIVTGGLKPGTEYEIEEVVRRWFRANEVRLRWVHEDNLKIVDQEHRVVSPSD